jgi:orotate phosphoribosyltransferase
VSPDLLETMNGRAGHFLLESGHHGDLWLDLDRLLVSAADLQRWAGGLADLLREHDVSAVCGPLVGGAVVAEFVAARLEVDCYYAQRLASATDVSYRIPARRHDELAGRRVAVVDDVVNAGSAVAKTRDALAEIGARPVVVGALLALGSHAEEQTKQWGAEFTALATVPSNLWDPDDCPLCRDGVALERPGEESG